MKRLQVSTHIILITWIEEIQEQQAINEKPDVIILAQSGDQEVNYSLRWKDEWHNANNLY